jgi:RNA recognition motif-containing protein
VRQEKPMLEDLLPGKTRGFRRRRARPTRPAGNTAPTKIFVGGLSPTSTSDTLRAYFEKFGVITDCAVVNEPGTKKSRGFGFVEFAEGIPAGLLEQEHIVGQRRCGVRPYDYQSEVEEVTECMD